MNSFGHPNRRRLLPDPGARPSPGIPHYDLRIGAVKEIHHEMSPELVFFASFAGRYFASFAV